ncbi:hypothetical protein NQ015_03775 [Corynebacterium sp. 153RC1]|uniref:hypothetical protein n=1 Tax=unclassified Corynebacterium TaxID=2624378 RepID=UPI00211BC1A7|nr:MULTISPECIES: hypothetical protein [unclassified Corynebacterium]MCQ9370333.1 hypothetical protein [Corynebacterium sp. 35RC1]MCQ9351991.1 hypothetical protein [Corynebacterium sp. 209RC1]MCQ9353740.1 hypothetical protein [Corynebacterium sp. 1222RC1]MCQ9356276.1 hypothetical protein [Corynebacterium sp. 122RC1]MCQ9358378.1 hypothetical protein [Corynebacterium sp. 142RC1]
MRIAHQNPMAPRPLHEHSASELASHIARAFPQTLSKVGMALHHPRSLARPTPTWRPPTFHLPQLPGEDDLQVSITRRRVGAKAKARLQGFGEAPPAYLITARVTSPKGYYVQPNIAEAWVRALVGEQRIDCVHVIESGQAATFLWLVDGHFQPLHSPARMFQSFAEAA